MYLLSLIKLIYYEKKTSTHLPPPHSYLATPTILRFQKYHCYYLPTKLYFSSKILTLTNIQKSKFPVVQSKFLVCIFSHFWKFSHLYRTFENFQRKIPEISKIPVFPQRNLEPIPEIVKKFGGRQKISENSNFFFANQSNFQEQCRKHEKYFICMVRSRQGHRQICVPIVRSSSPLTQYVFYVTSII